MPKPRYIRCLSRDTAPTNKMVRGLKLLVSTSMVTTGTIPLHGGMACA
jgi:hypothetical protein